MGGILVISVIIAVICCCVKSKGHSGNVVRPLTIPPPVVYTGQLPVPGVCVCVCVGGWGGGACEGVGWWE